METIRYKKSKLDLIIERPVPDAGSLDQKVRKILKSVKQKGDKAVRKFTREFDRVDIRDFQVKESEFQEAERLVSEELKMAILVAMRNIETYHRAQITEDETVETMPGVKCWRKSRPIEKVGLYIPGGTAPLFSTVLMLGIPACLAGCSKIVLCSPPGKDGKIHPAILYTAYLVGIRFVFKVGGVQAIAAMAYGTASIPAVYKIFGPGNQYILTAKKWVQLDGLSIDMPAGPSEVAVFADESANPRFVASDLLSQAEHGPDSQVLLVTGSGKIAGEVKKQIREQLKRLPRMKIAVQALNKSRIVLVKNESEAIEILNAYAPEHLILNSKNAGEMAEKVINAGSVFIGPYSPESVGDYASGTNHTLPTNGFAKAYSGLSLDSFRKKISFQQLSKEGLEGISIAVEMMAEAEGLRAHAEAVRVRLEK
jgi:histidinol dehydrogenase